MQEGVVVSIPPQPQIWFRVNLKLTPIHHPLFNLILIVCEFGRCFISISFLRSYTNNECMYTQCVFYMVHGLGIKAIILKVSAYGIFSIIFLGSHLPNTTKITHIPYQHICNIIIKLTYSVTFSPLAYSM